MEESGGLGLHWKGAVLHLLVGAAKLVPVWSHDGEQRVSAAHEVSRQVQSSTRSSWWTLVLLSTSSHDALLNPAFSIQIYGKHRARDRK